MLYKGIVGVEPSLQFSYVDPGSFLLFTLTYTGPPTTIIWRGPNGVLSNADSTVTILNSRTNAMEIKLRVTGNVPGEYTLTIFSARTTGGVTSTFTVTGTHTHSLSACITQPLCSWCHADWPDGCSGRCWYPCQLECPSQWPRPHWLCSVLSSWQ